MTRNLPPIEDLRKLLRYDPNTGKLFWRERAPDMFSTICECKRFNSRYAGKPSFTSPCNGYLSSSINGSNHYAHRIAWAIYYGVWPQKNIDHINGIRSDNRIVNLRDVSQSVNLRNTNLKSNNSSGYNGVFWDKSCNKWIAQIATDSGKRKNLGRFSDINNAIKARQNAEKGTDFTDRHGSNK